MMNSPSQNPDRRAEELFDKMLDHGLTDAEHGELAHLLEQDSGARERFRDAIYLHALLREEASAGRCDPVGAQLFGLRPGELAELTAKLTSAGWEGAPKSAPVRPIESRSSAGRKWAGRPAFAVGAAVLAFALCYETWLRPQAVKLLADPTATSKSNAAAQENISPTPVAQLTYTSGCTWGASGGEMPALNSHVRLGDEVVLHEGIAEFRLSSGVSFNVEGPSALVITSPTSFILQHGTTTVLVPSKVKDFRLAAASCRITASGAEFGLHVAGGKLDVHAFIGTVLATPTIQDDPLSELTDVGADSRPPGAGDATGGSTGAGFTTTPIVAGQGVTLDCQTDSIMVSEWHTADESRFATRLSMAGSLPITKKYVDSVLKSKPLGYWRFESEEGNIVANEIGELAGLAISGKVYFTTDGRNRAVELGRPGFAGALYCKNELNLPAGSDYSVEAWIKPSHYHNGSIVAMNVAAQPESQIDEKTSFYLQTVAAITRPRASQRRVRFLHRDPPSSIDTGTNSFSSVPYRLRRWQHLVAVKQGPEMKLYLDGAVVDTQHDPGSLAPNLILIVGQIGQSVRAHRFIGQIDELAIYSHALPEEEIVSRFKLVDRLTKQTSEIGERGI